MFDISLSVTRDCKRRYLEQYRTTSRYHAATGRRRSGCPLSPRVSFPTLPRFLSPKISSLHRRPGSSVLPATTDFSTAAHNGHVMRCIVKNELRSRKGILFCLYLENILKGPEWPCKGYIHFPLFRCLSIIEKYKIYDKAANFNYHMRINYLLLNPRLSTKFQTKGLTVRAMDIYH